MKYTRPYQQMSTFETLVYSIFALAMCSLSLYPIEKELLNPPSMVREEKIDSLRPKGLESKLG